VTNIPLSMSAKIGWGQGGTLQIVWYIKAGKCSFPVFSLLFVYLFII
jgi:hypothetical protein